MDHGFARAQARSPYAKTYPDGAIGHGNIAVAVAGVATTIVAVDRSPSIAAMSFSRAAR
jgi:hypothetical protein